MSIWKQKKQLIFIALVMVVLTLPLFAQARGLVPCGGYLADGSREPACDVEYIFILIARLTNWLIGLAGFFAVYQIVNAGFWLITTMGNEEAISKHRKTLTNAVIGFALAMMGYLFINTAVNLLLAMEQPGKTVNLKRPLCYVYPDPEKCTVDRR